MHGSGSHSYNSLGGFTGTERSDPMHAASPQCSSRRRDGRCAASEGVAADDERRVSHASMAAVLQQRCGD